MSYTTDKAAARRERENYNYISKKAFSKMSDDGEFFETTTYAHQFYGSRKEDVEKILSEGKHVLTVMDICGAMALKTHFPNVVTIYVKRDKKDLVMDILSKDCSNEDKANRLLAIDAEQRNAQICDYTVNFDSAEKAADEIMQRLDI